MFGEGVVTMTNCNVRYVKENEYISDEFIHLFSLSQDRKTVVRFYLQSTSSVVQRNGMEFLYMNQLYDELETLIHQSLTSNQTLNMKWAQVYQLMLHQRLRPGNVKKIKRKVDQFQTDHIGLKCLLEFINISIQIQQYDFRFIGNSITKVEQFLECLHDPFLENSFQIRLKYILFLYYWARNEVIIARQLAYQLLADPLYQEIDVMVHMNLGLTYLFESYSTGMNHLRKAHQLSKKYRRHYLTYILENHYIPFFSACFEKVDGLYSQDIDEQAHLEIAKGNHEKAISLLKRLPLNTPFRLYYMGLAKQSSHLLLKAYESFRKDYNHYFFCRLPLYAWRKSKSQ